MKNFFRYGFQFFCMNLPHLSFASSQVSSTYELVPYLNQLQKGPGHCLIMDIDETLVTTPQYLGSGRWFSKVMTELKRKGAETFKKEFDETVELWFSLQKATQLKLIEHDLPQVLKEWQEAGSFVVGLTARVQVEALYTLNKLSQLGYTFSVEATPQAPLWRGGPQAHGGIVFSNADFIDKGHALRELLKTEPFQSYCHTLTFVDDKLSHIEEVALTFAQVSHVHMNAVHYKASTTWDHPNISQVGEIQLKKFREENQLMSNEQALNELGF